MIAGSYLDLLEHKMEHEKVLAKLLNRLFSLKYDFIDFEQVQAFLLDWFAQHTIVVDFKLGKWLP